MSDNQSVIIERTINAPTDKVWRAWTDPAELQLWWGPRGVTNPTCQWQAEPGGKIHIVMLAGDELGPLAGQEWPMTGEFQTVTPQRELVFTSSPIMDGKPIMTTLCTVTFEPEGDKTKLTLSITVDEVTPAAEGPLAGMSAGWNQSLDKLAEYVK